MDKRVRLGIVDIWGQGWLGGKYYLQNLINALNTLDENKKPIINLYCLSNAIFDDYKHNTHYPYLEKSIVEVGLGYWMIRKAISFFSKQMAFKIKMFPLNPDDDVIFPLHCGTDKKRMLSWIADFQERHLPQNFSKSEIELRDEMVRSICKRKIPILFSSHDSQKDFLDYYNEYANHENYVVHFAVNQENFSDIDIISLRRKYGITKKYLLCANQFWRHKNHLFLFKAFKKCLDQGFDCQLVCTGNMNDYRNPEYIQQIKDYLVVNGLGEDILTLGVIDKKDLLCLMKNSYAVIQPSLFEGWNTTVEDCKAMGKYIFLSDLNVHREQITKNVCFFDPKDVTDLVNKLLNVVPEEETWDYSDNIRMFGVEFFNIVLSIYERNRAK